MSFFRIHASGDRDISQSLLGIENEDEEQENGTNSTRMTEISYEEESSAQFLTMLSNLENMEKEIRGMRELLEKRVNSMKKNASDSDSQVEIGFSPNGSMKKRTIQNDSYPPIKRPSKRKQWIGPKLQRYLFLISLFWQVLNVLLIAIIEHDLGVKETESQWVSVTAGIAVMLGFQLIHVLAVIVTSVKLTKQVLHRTVKPIFVFQSYLSTIVLFTGVYTLTYRITTSSFSGIHPSSDPDNSAVPILVVFISFLYFSVCTMSGVGYGDIVPSSWYSQLMVIFQMGLAVIFTVIIFAQGLHHFNKEEQEINSTGKDDTMNSSKSRFSSFFYKFGK